MNNYELRQRLYERKERWEIQQAIWLDALGLIVPMAAPLVPAFLTATAIIAHYPGLLGLSLGYVVAIAIVAGAVIELLGILSTETMFEMRSYNQKYQTDEAPYSYAVTAVVFYLVLVISLVLLLKIWHNLALWSLAPLTVLGFVTSWVMVLRKQHSDRVHNRQMAEANIVNRDIAERDQRINQLTEQLTNLQQQLTETAAALATANAQRLDSESRLSTERQTNQELTSQIAALTRQLAAPLPVKPPQRPARPVPPSAQPARLTPDQCRRAIIGALSEAGASQTFAQLVDSVNVTLNTIKSHCRWLAEQGQVDINQNLVTLKPAAALPVLTVTPNGFHHA